MKPRNVTTSPQMTLIVILSTATLVMRTLIYAINSDEEPRVYNWAVYIAFITMGLVLSLLTLRISGLRDTCFYASTMGTALSLYDLAFFIHNTVFEFSMRLAMGTFAFALHVAVAKMIYRRCCCCFWRRGDTIVSS